MEQHWTRCILYWKMHFNQFCTIPSTFGNWDCKSDCFFIPTSLSLLHMPGSCPGKSKTSPFLQLVKPSHDKEMYFEIKKRSGQWEGLLGNVNIAEFEEGWHCVRPLHRVFHASQAFNGRRVFKGRSPITVGWGKIDVSLTAGTFKAKDLPLIACENLAMIVQISNLGCLSIETLASYHSDFVLWSQIVTEVNSPINSGLHTHQSPYAWTTKAHRNNAHSWLLREKSMLQMKVKQRATWPREHSSLDKQRARFF